jgi:hypothetical protein
MSCSAKEECTRRKRHKCLSFEVGPTTRAAGSVNLATPARKRKFASRSGEALPQVVIATPRTPASPAGGCFSVAGGVSRAPREAGSAARSRMHDLDYADAPATNEAEATQASPPGQSASRRLLESALSYIPQAGYLPEVLDSNITAQKRALTAMRATFNILCPQGDFAAYLRKFVVNDSHVVGLAGIRGQGGGNCRTGAWPRRAA